MVGCFVVCMFDIVTESIISSFDVFLSMNRYMSFTWLTFKSHIVDSSPLPLSPSAVLMIIIFESLYGMFFSPSTWYCMTIRNTIKIITSNIPIDTLIFILSFILVFILTSIIRLAEMVGFEPTGRFEPAN